MKTYRFGKMSKISLPTALTSKCEVMQFESAGTPHEHDRPEIAIAVHGSGTVWIDDLGHEITAGEYVWIPAGVAHHMVPSDGEVLSMLIGYALETAP